MTTALIIIVWLGTMFFMIMGFVAWKFRYYFLTGRMRVRIMGELGHERVKVIKVESTDEFFDMKIFGELRRFNIRQNNSDATYIFYTGGERMPTSEYVATDPEPRSRRGISSDVSSVRYRQVATQKVVFDLLTVFKKPKITTTGAMMIILGVMLVGFLMLGVFFNQKIKEITPQTQQTLSVSNAK